jgi:hypothetical protein
MVFKKVIPHIHKWIYRSTLIPTKDKDSLYNRLVNLTDDIVDLYTRECNIVPNTPSVLKKLEAGKNKS